MAASLRQELGRFRRAGGENRLRFEKLERRQLLAAVLYVGEQDEFWRPLSELPAAESGLVSYLNPTSFTAWSLEREAVSSTLSRAPLEFTDEGATSPLVFRLPTPLGTFASFSVYEAPIMEPELAAEFPEIQTYRGQGIDDPAATLRLSSSPLGFHAQVLAPDGAYYIDPYWHQSDLAYISYFKRDLVPREDQRRFESRSDQARSDQSRSDQHGKALDGISSILESSLPLRSSTRDSGGATGDGDGGGGGKSGDGATAGRSGTQLRTYRLANAATGEYTAFHGGTVALGQAAIVASINRVVGIYEKEVAVRMVLVANNSTLVYTNGATDPYNNNDGGAMLGQNQTNVDNLIGNANYDIGHVFSTGGGGVAGLGVVGVTGQKARGVTGSGSPVGDPFDVDYVAHEMGHQFAGNHTFNGTGSACSGNRSSSAAYEPGSGSTIMGYAGICGADNTQNFSDPYFHSYSFDEIVSYTTSGTGNSSAAITNTGNSVPRIYAGRDYVIPASTAFALEAVAIDADSANVLTHNWEQRDLGAAQALSAADNGTSPLFRSWNPTTDPTRTFPRLPELLGNTTPLGERLPTTNRTMNFRAVVRDNFGAGGGVNTDDMRITVVNTGAAFSVTSPNSAVSYAANSQQTITWNVAGTADAAIGASTVDLWLSVDGGLTFPILLAGATPNDGSQTVQIPDLVSSTARVKVAARDSIFFDVSNTNFSIVSSSNSAPTISAVKNVWIPWNTSTAEIPFQVGDAQTPAAELSVSAFALNSTLIPASRITLGGTGANRTIQVRPTLGEYGDTQVLVGVTDAAGVTSYESFMIYVEPSFSCRAWEGFDGVTVPNLPSGWTTTVGSGTNRWDTSATSSHSGPNNAFSPNVASVSDTRLTSPVFTASQDSLQVRFQHSYVFESTFDGGVLEISIDGGSFADILTAGGQFLSGGYNATLSTAYQNPLGGRSAWSGNSNGYRATVVQLPNSALNKSVQLRWRLGTDSSVAATGWRVDTIEQCGFVSPPILSIAATDTTKDEGDSGLTPFVFTVSRRGLLSAEVTVNYEVSGFGANPASGNDFESGFPSGTVTIPANSASVVLEIPVRGDVDFEEDEGFRILLSNASGTTLLDVSESTGTILNDDPQGQPPTDILLSADSVNENRPAETVIGQFSSEDPDAGDTHTYTLVAGSGDTDNARFAIATNQLKLANPLDYETQSVYSIRVRSSDSQGLFFEKSFTVSAIDLPELVGTPVFGDGTAQRSRVEQIVVTFDGEVDLDEGALIVTKRGTGGGTVTTTVTTGFNGQGAFQAVVRFSGQFTRGSFNGLIDGNYELLIDGTKVTRNTQQLDADQDGIGGDSLVLGDQETDKFFALYGDLNGDRILALSELTQFRAAYGSASGQTAFRPLFDYDGNNNINLADLLQFRSRYGRRLDF